MPGLLLKKKELAEQRRTSPRKWRQKLYEKNPETADEKQLEKTRTSGLPFYIYQELPHYLQDNDCIRTGYRANYTYSQAWASLLHIHNETGNIYTHLLPFFASLLLAYDVVFPAHGWLQLATGASLSTASILDRSMLMLFLTGACISFSFSSMFHLHYCCGKKGYEIFGCLDYSGISALVFSSVSSLAYYLLQDRPVWEIAVWQVLIALTNLSGFLGPYFEKWRKPEWRAVRVFVYAGSGMMIIGPIIHRCIVSLMNDVQLVPDDWSVIGLFPLSWAVYILGATVYVKRFPERLSPGRFDVIGMSHQIWHCLVVFAAYLHLCGICGLIEKNGGRV